MRYCFFCFSFLFELQYNNLQDNSANPQCHSHKNSVSQQNHSVTATRTQCHSKPQCHSHSATTQHLTSDNVFFVSRLTACTCLTLILPVLHGNLMYFELCVQGYTHTYHMNSSMFLTIFLEVSASHSHSRLDVVIKESTGINVWSRPDDESHVCLFSIAVTTAQRFSMRAKDFVLTFKGSFTKD